MLGAGTVRQSRTHLYLIPKIFVIEKRFQHILYDNGDNGIVARIKFPNTVTE